MHQSLIVFQMSLNTSRFVMIKPEIFDWSTMFGTILVKEAYIKSSILKQLMYMANVKIKNCLQFRSIN